MYTTTNEKKNESKLVEIARILLLSLISGAITFSQNLESSAEPSRNDSHQNRYRDLENTYACFMVLSDGTFVSLNPLCNVPEPRPVQVIPNSKPPVYTTFSTGGFRAYYFNGSNSKPVMSYRNSYR
jgi:hypothetical protein